MPLTRPAGAVATRLGPDHFVPVKVKAFPKRSTAAQNVADAHETSSKLPPAGSAAAGAAKVMAGQTIWLAVAEALPPAPVAVSVKVYGTAVEPLKAGRLTLWLTALGVVPAAHAKLAGSPAIAGEADSTQVDERTTDA